MQKALVLSLISALALLIARPLVSADQLNFQVKVVRPDFSDWAGFPVTIWLNGGQVGSGVTNVQGDVFFSLEAGKSYEFRAGFASTTATVTTVPSAALAGVILMPTVRIDIKPGFEPNDVNLKEKGVLPVAILGCSAVDVTRINPATIKIGNVGLATRGKGVLMYSFKDVNSDGHVDLLVFFDVPALVANNVLTAATVSLTLTATLDDGSPTEGTDFVNIVL